MNENKCKRRTGPQSRNYPSPFEMRRVAVAHCVKIVTFSLLFLFLTLSVRSSRAISRAILQAGIPTVTLTPTSTTVPTPTLSVDNIQATLTSFSQKLDDLDTKLNHPPKDFWDILTSISGLVSGIIVAIIGIVAVVVANRIQKTQKEQELEVQRVQIVQGFMPYLLKSKTAANLALEAIIALGDKELVARLATLTGSAKAVSILTSLAVSKESKVAEAAQDSLQKLYAYLKPALVEVISKDGTLLGTGFFVTLDGRFLTSSKLAPNVGEDIRIRIDGKQYTARELLRGSQLYVGQIDPNNSATLIIAKTPDINAINSVIVMGYSSKEMIFALARTSPISETANDAPTNTASVQTKIDDQLIGSPVIDIRRKLIGVVIGVTPPKDDESDALIEYATTQTISEFLDKLNPKTP